MHIALNYMAYLLDLDAYKSYPNIDLGVFLLLGNFQYLLRDGLHLPCPYICYKNLWDRYLQNYIQIFWYLCHVKLVVLIQQFFPFPQLLSNYLISPHAFLY